MDFALIIIFGVLAYISYINFRDEPKRREREKKFKEFDNLPESVKVLISADKKIEAIKEYRSLYQTGLKKLILLFLHTLHKRQNSCAKPGKHH